MTRKAPRNVFGPEKISGLSRNARQDRITIRPSYEKSQLNVKKKKIRIISLHLLLFLQLSIYSILTPWILIHHQANGIQFTAVLVKRRSSQTGQFVVMVGLCWRYNDLGRIARVSFQLWHFPAGVHGLFQRIP